MPSHPDYAEIANLANLIALATNPHLVLGWDMDLLPPEQAALVCRLKNEMAEKLDVVVPRPFYEFLKGT